MTGARYLHHPVLGDEVLSLVGPALGPGRLAVDCTVGGGGHTEALLSTGADVIGLDRDEAALRAASERLRDRSRLSLIQADFRDVERVVREAGGGRAADAVLADLGVSSPQLDVAERGFSFRQSGPLDMRMDRSSGRTLGDLLDEVGVDDLTRVIRDFGEERRARQVAAAILREREAGGIADTARLAEVVARAVGRSRGRQGGIHPATRTFQALRIWVNDELSSLDDLLASLPGTLSYGGRAAIISFHSLEDRKVKRAFAELSRGCVCPPDFPVCRCERTPSFKVITKRAVKPGEEEMARNPRARSARLRAIEKLSGSGARGPVEDATDA